MSPTIRTIILGLSVGTSISLTGYGLLVLQPGVANASAKPIPAEPAASAAQVEAIKKLPKARRLKPGSLKREYATYTCPERREVKFASVGYLDGVFGDGEKTGYNTQISRPVDLSRMQMRKDGQNYIFVCQYHAHVDGVLYGENLLHSIKTEGERECFTISATTGGCFK